jgi:hypothetical protein
MTTTTNPMPANRAAPEEAMSEAASEVVEAAAKYERLRQQQRAASERWKARNPERVKADQAAQHRKRTAGITAKDTNAALADFRATRDSTDAKVIKWRRGFADAINTRPSKTNENGESK